MEKVRAMFPFLFFLFVTEHGARNVIRKRSWNGKILDEELPRGFGLRPSNYSTFLNNQVGKNSLFRKTVGNGIYSNSKETVSQNCSLSTYFLNTQSSRSIALTYAKLCRITYANIIQHFSTWCENLEFSVAIRHWCSSMFFQVRQQMNDSE